MSDLLSAPRQTINNSLGVFRRALSYIFMNGPELFQCIVSPFDLHLLSPNFARTSSTLVVRPASLSARPFSID